MNIFKSQTSMAQPDWVTFSRFLLLTGYDQMLIKQNQTSQENPPPTRIRRRYTIDEGSGDLIECSGKHCRSCIGGLIADCVAICCCPCALVSLVALAFVKVPWKVGRRCLGLGKKKRKCKRSCSSEKNGLKDPSVVLEISSGFDEEGEQEFDQDIDRVWFELYQIGHLGFGRVSFSGSARYTQQAEGD